MSHLRSAEISFPLDLLWPLICARLEPASQPGYEVLSPDTAARDPGEKRIVYAKAGVRHLWLVDPAQRTLETFELRDGRWNLLETFRDAAKVVAPPFLNLSFPLELDMAGRSSVGRAALSGCEHKQGKVL